MKNDGRRIFRSLAAVGLLVVVLGSCAPAIDPACNWRWTLGLDLAACGVAR